LGIACACHLVGATSRSLPSRVSGRSGVLGSFKRGITTRQIAAQAPRNQTGRPRGSSSTGVVMLGCMELAFGRPEEGSIGSGYSFGLRFSMPDRSSARSRSTTANRLLTLGGSVRFEGFEHSSKLAAQSRRLDEEALKLSEDRRLRVSLIEDLVAPGVTTENAGGRQLFEVSRYGALCDCGEPDELPDIEGLVRVSEEPPEKPPAGLSKERRRRPAAADAFPRRTHF
jgi:hypothetical protein